MAELSEAATAALKECLATRGPNKGLLLAKAPPMRTLAYAAWQGAMMSCNPYKVSIGGMMFMSDEQIAINKEVTDFFDARPALRHADRDRAALETLGVWFW